MHPKNADIARELVTITAEDVGPMPAGVIVAAVGTGAAAKDPSRAQRLEAAMAAAITEALAEGISLEDTDAIRARMRAAREAVLDAERSSFRNMGA